VSGELEALLLRFDAPLMSFGGVLVDERGVTEPCPTLAMLVGLLGNALGYEHRQADALERLQERLRFAVRRDRSGAALVDFQTVDLSQESLGEGWTTAGAPAGRRGGSAGTGIHIRRRHFWADAVFTVALRFEPATEEPDLERCADALARPERPLFLGRKPCIPSEPLVLGTVRAGSLRAALAAVPLSRRAGQGPWTVWWPAAGEPSQVLPVAPRRVAFYDRRDWRNQIHVGRRFVWQGQLREEELEGTGV
jgi:CRISPR system Cascade subunit CasD